MTIESRLSSFALICIACVTLSAQEPNVLTHPTVSMAVGFVVTPPLRDIINEQPQDLPFGFHEANPPRYPKLQKLTPSVSTSKSLAFQDPAAQTVAAPNSVPEKLLDWLGVGQGFFGFHVSVPTSDGNLSIGDTQIVQWVNHHFAVFDLNGNNLLVDGQHYLAGNALFTGLPRCGVSNSGDIVAQWDKMAHRWVMMQPAMAAPARDCIAISQTPDALGPWFAYEFATVNPDTDLPDYPKMGVWPDAYYVSHNDFYLGQTFRGTMPCAYERAKMLAGDPAARQVCFLDSVNGAWPESFDDSQVPSDLDSPNNLPPGGTPNLYMGSIDNSDNGIESNVYYYKFHVDWNNPQNSTFSCVNGSCKIPVDPFHIGIWLGTAPEPGGNVLATLADRLMYRLAYRALPSQPTQNNHVPSNTVQSWVVSHAVNNNGVLALRWYEFRAPSGSTDPKVYQQGTYSPDSNWRFMSSIGMDKMSNIAMSYTVTSSSVYPSMAFTGRGAGDPKGTMGPEQIVIAGTGSETDTANRWGDYFDLAISNDGCTFVATGQYYTTTSSYNWSTRVAKLKFGNCNP